MNGENKNTIQLIGITGRKRSGKDTAGKYLVEQHGFVRLAFADALKNACKIIFGMTDEQVHGDELKEAVDPYWGHSPREILQRVGTELFRETLPKICPNISNDIWIRSVERQLQNLIGAGHTRFVITDVRFQNELDFVHKYGSSVKITRGASSNDNNSHASETMIDDFKCKFYVSNDKTIRDLHEDMDNILLKLRL